MQEFFDILDENGNKTGQTKARSLVHKDGDWHAAVHIWIVNEKGEILLQKRAPQKDRHPNMWGVSSVGGHLSAGDEILDAAVREVKEEVGLKIKPEDLKKIGICKFAAPEDGTGFNNKEFRHIFFLKIDKKVEDLVMQEDEVSELKFVPIEEFKKLLEKNDGTIVRAEEEEQLVLDYLESILQ